MAAKDISPAGWLDSWSEDGTDITLPIASVAGLTPALADGTTGDVREVVRLLLEELLTHQDGVATEAIIENMLITKAQAVQGADKIQSKFTVVFESGITASAVEAEAEY